MKNLIAIILFACLFIPRIQAQDLVPPLDIPLYLSGNFGELRANHFHSGIDFKTQGITGLPVKSVQDGYISRISVSPYGYGHALYINHPDGTTSVYAHLDKFVPRIGEVVRDSQYIKESFGVNLFFTPEQLPVAKGEKIAYSGNTGGSGGPHVHFEIRETASEEPLDPLPYFRNKIKDTRPPEIKGLMIFPQFDKGVVNGSAANQAIPLIKNAAGVLVPRDIITAWGEIGVGIKAYDRMDETSNIYGVNEIILKVNGEEVYHSVMNRFSFDDTRYLNTYIDWNSWINSKEFYMKSFADPGNRLKFNQSLYNGTVIIDKEKDYLFEYTLKDVYGNTSTFDFSIAGVETTIPVYESDDPYFRFNRDNEYAGKGIEINIPRGNLYSDVYVAIDTTANFTPYGPLYTIGKRIPLHTYCSLTLDIPNDTYPDKSKYGVVYNWDEKRSWLGGEHTDVKIKTKIRELGDFSIEVDSVAPVIKPVNMNRWTSLKRISFKITDDLSGIATYRGTLDGNFILFEYDAKTASLYYIYDPKRQKKGTQLLELTVTDSAGNQSIFSNNVVM
ncbi:M23 family metallopeptidase [Bacteroidales bacterium OttesenSCG-928-M06]|nr:M23 family metallopeptidase [Bacteroidales bacterium OttesenSCG-928-M06]